MNLELATPALLFPAVSLLMLAYTNRFLALAALVRTLHDRWREDPRDILERQIVSLRQRIYLTRGMQAFGALSILLSVATMFLLYQGWEPPARVAFALALVSLLASLALSMREIHISVRALDLQLSDMEQPRDAPPLRDAPESFTRKSGSGPRD